MPLFVNLPLSFAHAMPRYVDMFIEQGICPELGMDTVATHMVDEAWHQNIAARFRTAGLTCAVHLPFFDLSPGSMNDGILAATRDTLQRAARLAGLYAPAHLIGHPQYNKGEHEPRLPLWLERSTQTWRAIQRILPGVPLYLENTHERSPRPILDLLHHLDQTDPHQEHRTGFCLDIGHWHSFARGAQLQDIEVWLAAIGTRLQHLHLHDNDGSDDQHMGLGKGSIPLERLFATLHTNAIRPSATLEPHDEEAFETSLRYFAEHPDHGAALRL